MLPIKFYRADSSTYVIKTANGKVIRKGKGLSFFYNTATTSIAAIPVNTQGAPFIFNLKTADFQDIRIQGRLNFRVADPDKTAEVMNFNLNRSAKDYAGEDPLNLNEQVIRSLQSVVQTKIQAMPLKQALFIDQKLFSQVETELKANPSLATMGVEILDLSIAAITPAPETAKALEAKQREEILKQADDAIYARRKCAVEQERTIQEAELATKLFVQQKEQQIEADRIAKEREILRAKAATAKARIQSKIDEENQNSEYVAIRTKNKKQESDADAYAISVKMKAYKELSADYIKAFSMSQMNPEQIMALAFESFAQNASKIGELNIGQESFGRMLRKEMNNGR